MARPVRLPARSKYHATPTVVDGIRFASKLEAFRYGQLKVMEKAGVIFRLRLQPRYRLCAWTRHADTSPPELGDYVADFRYCDDEACLCAWGCHIEDVKGMATPLYKWKKKHVEAQYGITVREIR
jgi:hypothetical protein